MKQFNICDAVDFVYPVPSLLEQCAIATVLSDMAAEIAVLEACRTKTQALKQGMMQQLLTGKVRLKIKVDIDVRMKMIDPELLEQLRTASVGDRIAVIEVLVQSLKSDIISGAYYPLDIGVVSKRPAFGFMKDTGSILGDVIAPVLPESAWEVLR